MQLQIFIQANYYGKKLKTCQEWPHLLSGCFIKVFYKMATCPRWPLLSGPESGHLYRFDCNMIWSDSAVFSFRRILAKKQSSNFIFWSKQVFFDQKAIQFDPHCLLQLFWWFSWKLSVWFHLCLLSNFVQKTIWFDCCNNVYEEDFWILKLNINTAYYSATSLCLTSFQDTAAWNKVSETKMWKKPHYLMLTSNPLFEFPLVHEVICHGLFETILRGFSTIAFFIWVARLGMIFSKLFYAKTRKDLDNQFSKNSVR